MGPHFPALMVLACLDGATAQRGLGRILLVFGRVPPFTTPYTFVWFTLWRFLWARSFINPSPQIQVSSVRRVRLSLRNRLAHRFERRAEGLAFEAPWQNWY